MIYTYIYFAPPTAPPPPSLLFLLLCLLKGNFLLVLLVVTDTAISLRCATYWNLCSMHEIVQLIPSGIASFVSLPLPLTPPCLLLRNIERCHAPSAKHFNRPKYYMSPACVLDVSIMWQALLYASLHTFIFAARRCRSIDLPLHFPSPLILLATSDMQIDNTHMKLCA